jgi:2-polyprenyl-3-methyl-5-hydroxy-6-metoxy-1,4-benzoquinol methylase
VQKFNSLQDFYRYVARLHITVKKNDLICRLCEAKEVLDIGCIDHCHKTALELGDDWLHARIKRVAKSLTGLDILKNDAEVLNSLGYNITVADAENFETGVKYDVINAGDIVEHLSNIGSLLDSVRRHLKDDGIVVITTPNPFNVEQFCSIVFSNFIVVNDQHTVWLDPRVLWQMATRHGFTVTDFYWIETRFKILRESRRRRLMRFVVAPLAELLMKWRPLFGRDYCLVLKIARQPTEASGT